jgi:localization factor PodJL
MRRSVFAKLDDLDPETRSAAEAAARKAGLRLEDWVGEILADRLARQSPRPPKKRVPADELETLIDRMAKSGRHSLPEKPDASLSSAEAIESVARWIERAEARLGDSARHSSDHQDRMASAMSEALTALKERLDTVERRVLAERSPARIEFPVEDAVKALSPLADTLVGLRADVSQLAERLDQSFALQPAQAIDAVASQIAELKAALAALATREEIDSLDGSLQGLVRDLEKRPTGKSILTLVGAIDTLHGQVADLSDDLKQEFHVRLASEIESIERKIDRLAQSGVDRSVIDFLSSQIIDLRHDLANRAEPQQIERLSEAVAHLTGQIGELRSEQVGRADFTALKAALEKVCGALSKSAAQQQANDVPDQIRGLGDKLDALALRPEPEPADLEPIASRVADLTSQMAEAADRRFDDSQVLLAHFDRLSAQIGSALETSHVNAAPLWERFDKLESGLREIGNRADTSKVEALVRSLEDKLRPTSSSLSQRFLQDEAASITERAVKEALKATRSESGPPDNQAMLLQHAFAEMKSLQARAEGKTHQTLIAVQEALETLVGRLADREPALLSRATEKPTAGPADRLEAAVRRLHAATLSQIEEVSAISSAPDTNLAVPTGEPHQSRIGASISGQERDLGNVRASFIAAARRASQSGIAAVTDEDGEIVAPEPAETPPSIIERIRKTFRPRRPLLFSVALLAIAAGAWQIHAREEAPTGRGVVARAGTEASAPLQTPSVIQASTFVAPPSAPSKAATPAIPERAASDVPEALRRAVAAENPTALYEMASRIENPAASAQLFERAARAGLVPAQQRLAAMYEQGVGVDRDLARAIGWYERAAEGGNLKAMHHLATLLAAGAQGQPDYTGAFRWYTEAAEAGHPDSQFNLGVLLTRGIGAARNLPRAYQWFDVAARQGDSDAAAKRNEIAKRLAPPELAAARLLAERWRARPVDKAANEVFWTADDRTASLDPRFGEKS